MKNCTDLNLGEFVYISIIYHIPDCLLYLRISCDFYFMTTLVHPPKMHVNDPLLRDYVKINGLKRSNCIVANNNNTDSH